VRDEGGPFGVGFQERAPNHSKLLWSKAMVVSVGGQSVGDNPEPVGVRETTERKPSLTRRKERKRRQNQGRVPPGDKPAGYLITGQAATGVEGA